jgi:hypothetical protein
MKKQINPSIKAHLLPSLFILLSLLVIGSTVARALQLSTGSQSQGPASAGAVGAFAPSAQAGVAASPGGITAVGAPEAPNDPAVWQPGPPQPPARYAFQAALGTDNMLYVAGGQTADMVPTLYDQVSRYDSTTNTWSNVAPLPVALGQGTIGAANGKIFVAGGFIGGTSVTNALRIYDIATNTWTSGANMPTSPGVEAAAGAVVNGKFYVMGGDDFTNGLNTNFIYDIATNTWSTGAPLPDFRTNTYGTAYNGLIYVYGGVILPAFTTTDTLLRYDPVANSWTNLGSAGTGGLGNYGGISPVGTGQLLITDGANAMGNSTTATHIFTISSGTFSAGAAMIGNRAGHAQGTLPDGRVLVADGFNTATTTVSTVELLTASSPTVTSAVSRKLHAGVPYDIAMPTTGTDGVECRTTGGTNDYTLVVTFSGNVTVTGNPQAAVTSGTGCVGTGGVCNGNTVTVSGAVVTVPLTGITNAQNINVRIFGVNGAADAPATDFDFPMGFLIGDDNGNRTVNAADIALDKSQLGQPVTATNFKEDENCNGAINAADIAIVKGHSGTSIP